MSNGLININIDFHNLGKHGSVKAIAGMLLRFAEMHADNPEVKAKRESSARIKRLKGCIKEYEILEFNGFSEEEILSILDFAERSFESKNVGSIFQKAVPFFREDVCPEKVDLGWIRDWESKAKLSYTEDAQTIWSKVLSGEFNKPGTYSRRAMTLLSDMSQDEAQAFKKICRFSIKFSCGQNNPLPFFSYQLVEKIEGSPSLEELDIVFNIGLLEQTRDIYANSRSLARKEEMCSTYIESKQIEAKGENIQVPGSKFSHIGCELMNLCRIGSAPGLLEEIRKRLAGYDVNIIERNIDTETATQ